MDPIETTQSNETSNTLNVPITNIPPAMPESKKNVPIKKMVGIGCMIGVILLILVGFQLMSKSNKPTPPIVANPTLVPTPTPNRTLSLLATQSSFLALQENVASVSAAITNFIIDDPSLSPPVLELSLGF